MSVDDALVMILAGGEGKRLHPLTLERAKPAVPFGGSGFWPGQGREPLAAQSASSNPPRRSRWSKAPVPAPR